VSGGSFPAEIWRRFMEPALASRAPRDFPEPRQSPEYEPWQRGPYSLTYDPNYVAPTETETTDTAMPWTFSIGISPPVNPIHTAVARSGV